MSILTGLIRFFRIPGVWKILAAMLVYGCGTGILGPMNAIYLKNGLHLSKLEISLLVSITLVINMSVTFFSGLLSDHMKNRKYLPIIASAISICGLFGYDHANSFITALIFYALSTTPSGAMVGQLYAMARSHFAEEAPDIVEIGIVWLRTLMSIGFFIGLLLGAQLYTLVTFHGVIIGNLICYAIILILFVFYRERHAVATLIRQEGTSIEWVTLVAVLMILCCDQVRGLYFPLMVDTIYKNPTVVSHLWSVQVIFEFVWMTLAGVAAQRYGGLRVTIFAGFAALFVYCVYAMHPALPWLYAAQPIYSFFVSVINTVTMGIIQRMFLHRAGFGSSLYFVLSQGASLIGYMIPNVVSGFSPHIFYLPAMLMVVAVGLLFGQQYFAAKARVTDLSA